MPSTELTCSTPGDVRIPYRPPGASAYFTVEPWKAGIAH